MSEPVDWKLFRKCPVCFAALGTPCTTQTGVFLGGIGYIAGAPTVLRDRPHGRRKLRTGAVTRG